MEPPSTKQRFKSRNLVAVIPSRSQTHQRPNSDRLVMISSNHSTDEKQIVAPQEATPHPQNHPRRGRRDWHGKRNPRENASRYLFCGHSSGLLSTAGGEERDTGRDRWLGQDSNTETWVLVETHSKQEHRYGDSQTTEGMVPWQDLPSLALLVGWWLEVSATQMAPCLVAYCDALGPQILISD